MAKENENNFAKVFNLGKEVNGAVIFKCLAAGILMGRATEKTALTLHNNPGLTRDICRLHISNNVGKLFPGLKEQFTAEQAEVLIGILAQDAKLFSEWK